MGSQMRHHWQRLKTSTVNNETGSQGGKWPGKVQAYIPSTPSLPIVTLTESAQMGGKQRPHSPNVQPLHGLEVEENKAYECSSDTPRHWVVLPLRLPIHTQRFQSGLCSKKSTGQGPGCWCEPVGLLITANYQTTLGKGLIVSGL